MSVVVKEVKELGYKTCVLTDSFYSSEEKWDWFRAMDMAGLLDHMISSYDIRVLKDTPEAYGACLGVLKVSAKEAIFVDHQQYEMIGAKAAGIKPVAVLPIASRDINSDYTVESLGELPSLLERLNGAR